MSDNGRQFISEEYKDYLEKRGIKRILSSTYWPRGNGAVERFNRTFKSWITGMGKKTQLRERIRICLIHYRATPHCTTGKSPLVMNGRPMRLELQVMSPPPPTEVMIERRVAKQQNRNRKLYNKNHYVKVRPFKPGD